MRAERRHRDHHHLQGARLGRGDIRDAVSPMCQDALKCAQGSSITRYARIVSRCLTARPYPVAGAFPATVPVAPTQRCDQVLALRSAT